MRETLISRRHLLAMTAAGCIAPGFAHARDGKWAQSVALPHKVQEIYPATNGRWIHLAGGLIADGANVSGVTDRHVRWRPGLSRWEEMAPLPRALHHPNLVGHHGKIYALGGFASRPGRVDWQMQASTLVFHPNTNEWSDLPSAPMAHAETVCAELRGHLHVVGGRTPNGELNMAWGDHGDTDHHFVLHPEDEKWHQAAPALTRRNSAAGVAYNGLLYVVGGRTVGGGNVAALEVYDPSEDKWRTGTPMPQAQGGLAAAVLGNRLYAFGGEFFTSGGGVYAETWAYDPRSDRWHAGPPMLTPRHGLGAVTIDDGIYVIGGAAEASGRSTSQSVEIFSL